MFKFKHPTSFLFVASSNSGKSHAIGKLLENADKYFSTKFDRIDLYYNAYDSQWDNLKSVNFVKGPPPELNEEEEDRKLNKIIVFEDNWMTKDAQEKLIKYFCFGRHYNYTVIASLHTFHFNPRVRTVTLNAKNLILFANRRDMRALDTLFSQLGFDTGFLKAAFIRATSEKYGNLCISLADGISEELRISSNILGIKPVFYIPKKDFNNKPIKVSIDG
jgi:hypothetical protein